MYDKNKKKKKPFKKKKKKHVMCLVSIQQKPVYFVHIFFSIVFMALSLKWLNTNDSQRVPIIVLL